MGNFAKRAQEHQSHVRYQESRDNADYDEAHVRRSIVHAREDMILLACYLYDLNKQVATIRRLLWLILAASPVAAMLILK